MRTKHGACGAQVIPSSRPQVFLSNVLVLNVLRRLMFTLKRPHFLCLLLAKRSLENCLDHQVVWLEQDVWCFLLPFKLGLTFHSFEKVFHARQEKLARWNFPESEGPFCYKTSQTNQVHFSWHKKGEKQKKMCPDAWKQTLFKVQVFPISISSFKPR